MKIFVAGATGAIGKQLIPQLVAKGHDVVGMTRTPSKQDQILAQGATPVVADALDPDAVAQAVACAEPEIVIQQLTSLSGPMDLRHADRFFAETNLLRTKGTDHLLAAARAVGVRRYVSESYLGLPFQRIGGPIKTESDPLDPDPPKPMQGGVAAIRHLERSVSGIEWAEGLVLRNGPFYGPGTALSQDPDAQLTAQVRARQLPIIGDGGAIWSFLHISDAARAVVAATENGSPGIYQIADDEPAPVREWLPVLADALGAQPPRRIPRWLGRLLAGEIGTIMMTELRGGSNARAKRELGWCPYYSTWRTGFREGLGE